MNRCIIAIRREDRGSALLIILAFVLLLSIITVAFLSKASLARNVSNTSADQTRTEIFAQGALDAIVSDFQQEIAAGSTIDTSTFTSSTSGTVTVAVYTPSTALAAVPSRTWTSGSVYVSAAASTGAVNSGSDPLPNLIKRSSCALAFYPASDSVDYPNASSYPCSEKTFTSADPNDSTSAASLNGRYFTSQRWNQSLLLPKASLTSTDPTPVSNFTVPDWILVQRDGSNPTVWSTSLCAANPGDVTTANKNPVVGRYAYCVYNEGGLLDMNVAGFSSTTGSLTNLQYYKSSLASVDLTQLAVSAGSGPLVTSPQVDELVGWRNNATLQASGAMSGPYNFPTTAATNYFANVLGPTSGLMQTGNNALSSGQSDRRFASRQQLIDVMLSGIAASSTDTATLQNALQYMGTFSRDINQPSYVPDSGRPHMKAGTAADPAKYGGNDAGTDDVSNYAAMGNLSWTGYVNVPFPATLVQTAYVRNDGSVANVGDPLVKRRFALNRLAWLTYMGPIADDAGNLNNSASSAGYVGGNAAAFTTIINALEQTYGISASMLALGGPTNIKNYFGLQWQVDPTDNRYKWFYNVHNNSVASGKGIIRELGGPNAIAASGDTSPHDPDFFELLKATVLAGSKAKTLTTATILGSSGPGLSFTTTDPRNPLLEQFNSDVSLDYAIIQLGANIIDQFDTDSFATEIVFNNGSSAYSVNDDGTSGNKIFRGSENLPYLYRLRTGSMVLRDANTAITWNNTETLTTATTPGFVDTGVGALVVAPEIWDPYDYESPPGSPYPTGPFRLIADSADPSTAIAASGTLTGSTAPTGTASYTPIAIQALDPAGSPYNNIATTSTLHPPVTGTATPAFSYGPSDPAGSSGTMSFSGDPAVLTSGNTEIDFSPSTFSSGTMSLYYEPTLLARQSTPAGSGITMNFPSSAAGDLGKVKNAAGLCYPGGFIQVDTGTMNGIMTGNPLNVPTATLTTFANKYVGIVLGTFPLQWTMSYNSANYIKVASTASPYTPGSNVSPYITYRLQYPDPNQADPQNSWVTYDLKYLPIMSGWVNAEAGRVYDNLPRNGFPQTSTGIVFDQQSEAWMGVADPRSSRFGGANYMYQNANATASPAKNIYYSAPQLPLDSTYVVLSSDRPDFNFGFGMSTSTTQTLTTTYDNTLFAPGWSTGTTTTTGAGLWWGALSMNLKAQTTVGTGRYSFESGGATGGPTSMACYYSDPDGVVRRAMGAWTAGLTGGGTLNKSYGLPLATAEPVPSYETAVVGSTGGGLASTFPNLHWNRPYILNRPFRSVAELGYVFSGTPWKNLDFVSPESGDSALLDVFCVNDTDDPNALVEGKVDLNTHQIPVLADILTGAYFDDLNPSGINGYYIGQTKDAVNPSNSKYTNEPFTFACYLMQGPGGGTTGTSGSGTATPLRNLRELVGRWIGASQPQGTTGIDPTLTSNYQGYSADIDGIVNQTTGVAPSPVAGNDQRWREAAVRALSAVGETRVWNVMIDFVAQTGRYPSSATNAAQFVVEGERRYWVHLAIDRYTGQVLDRQIEEVKQ